MERKFILGEQVKDKITGFSGVVTGITFWLNGCTRVSIQPRELKDQKPIEAEWFDEQQLELTGSAPLDFSAKKRGGPMPDPKR
jgi:hypothetical protein